MNNIPYWSLTAVLQGFMLIFNVYRLLSSFHLDRLELNREPLNCPVDRNILIRDKVGDLSYTTGWLMLARRGSWACLLLLVFSSSSLTNAKIYNWPKLIGPDTAISSVSICRAGHYLFYRQFISAKNEEGIIFSWGFLIFIATTSLTAMKYIHKTYTFFTRWQGGGGGGLLLIKSYLRAGCVGTLHTWTDTFWDNITREI